MEKKLDRIVLSLGVTISFWKKDPTNTEHYKIARDLLDDLHYELTQNAHKYLTPDRNGYVVYVTADDKGYHAFNEEANAFKILFSHFLFKNQDMNLLLVHLQRTYTYLIGLIQTLHSINMTLRIAAPTNQTNYDSDVAAFQKSIAKLNSLHHQLLMLTDFNNKNKSVHTKHLRDEINKVYINQALAITNSISELTSTNLWFSDFVDLNSIDPYIDARDEFHNATRSNEVFIKIFTQATETGNLNHARVITNLFLTLNNLKVYSKEQITSGTVPHIKPAPNVASIHTKIWQSNKTEGNKSPEKLIVSQPPSLRSSADNSPK